MPKILTYEEVMARLMPVCVSCGVAKPVEQFPTIPVRFGGGRRPGCLECYEKAKAQHGGV